MSGSEFLVQALEREGVEVVFGFPGGAIMPVYDALYSSKLTHVLVRHEQAAALAADGYARVTGKVGVCMATSGPGATNLVTGIANAYMDSVPLVAITGQVPTALLGTDAFQEVDIMGITLPVVKHSFLPRRKENLPETIHEAFRLARSGRPGPVLIDLPKDVAASEGELEPCEPLNEDEPPQPDLAQIQKALELLRKSTKPIIYAGGGIGIGGAVEEFRRFVETTRIPVVATLKGLGALPTDHALFLGMLGMHGTKTANTAVQETDLLICVGARFDDRATGKLSAFAPHAKVIHMDMDRSELGKLRQPHVGLLGDLRPTLTALALPLDNLTWREECLRSKEKNRWRYDVPTQRVYAPRFLKRLSEAMDENTVIACDVGQHQMWVAQHCRFRHPRQHLTSAGLGAMGYGLPAAIGAHFGHPDSTVINVSGDGSIMMNFQELDTIQRYRIPVKIVVMDNQALGLVRQWQELFFERRYSEVDLSDSVDFVRVAGSFGIPGFTVEGSKDEESAIERLLSEPGPQLVRVKIDREANVWPLVPPNKSNSEMLMGVHK
jgi:acetolactate synthase-1/2/3 large subunit